MQKWLEFLQERFIILWIDRLFPSNDAFPCRNDPDYHGNVRYYLERAQKVHAISQTDDEAMLEHILEILAEIGPAKVHV